MKKKIVISFGIVVIAAIICIIAAVCYKNKTNIEIANNTKQNTEWTVTQYGYDDWGQMMAFSIEGNNDGLVLIDGGYMQSQTQIDNIREIIEKHNNQVEAWIITHTDADHVGVFNSLYKSNPEIKINTIYAPKQLTKEQAEENIHSVGDLDQYNNFNELKPENIKYLKKGDKIDDLLGLNVEVLWGQEDWVIQNSSNWVNNGSLIFKVEGKENTMLFCADVQDKKIGDMLLQEYGEKLKSDYLQVGHHGNNSFVNDFYTTVAPKTAIFCAPEWLITNEKQISWFTAPQIRAFLEENGVNVVYDVTSPNKVVIK